MFAVLSLIDVDKFAEESALTTIFSNQHGTLPISFLEAQAVALIISGQTIIAPSCDLIHGNNTWFIQSKAGIFLHLLIVLPVEGQLAESQITGGRTLLRQVFLLQFQRLQEALLCQSHVARLFADGT